MTEKFFIVLLIRLGLYNKSTFKELQIGLNFYWKLKTYRFSLCLCDLVAELFSKATSYRARKPPITPARFE